MGSQPKRTNTPNRGEIRPACSKRRNTLRIERLFQVDLKSCRMRLACADVGVMKTALTGNHPFPNEVRGTVSGRGKWQNVAGTIILSKPAA